jgi:hypothetical protein
MIRLVTQKGLLRLMKIKNASKTFEYTATGSLQEYGWDGFVSVLVVADEPGSPQSSTESAAYAEPPAGSH